MVEIVAIFLRLWYVIFQVQPYLHESRHQHAIRRARASGGRFAKKSDVDDSKKSNEAKDNGKNSISATSAQSFSSSGSEPLPPDSNLNYYQEARGSEINAQTYVNDSGMYRNQEGATSLVQHWGNIRSDQAQQRATAMHWSLVLVRAATMEDCWSWLMKVGIR